MSNSMVKLLPDEIDNAVRVIAGFLTTKELTHLLPKHDIDQIGQSIPKTQTRLACHVVQRYGPELLANDRVRFLLALRKGIDAPTEWVANSDVAVEFVETLGMPLVFSGSRDRKSPATRQEDQSTGAAKGFNLISERAQTDAISRMAQLLSPAELKGLLSDGVRTLLATDMKSYSGRDIAEMILLLSDIDLFRDARFRKLLGQKLGIESPDRWVAGKKGAILFVTQCGFDERFAGVAPDGKLPSHFDVEPYVKLAPLHDWQTDLARRALSFLKGRYEKKRAILSLPTGAGKTRTVVHSLVELLWQEEAHSRPIIWIAQSEELCEQAIASIEQVWLHQSVRLAETDRRAPFALRIQRFFGTYDLDSENPQVIVTSIQKLHRCIERIQKDPDRADVFNVRGMMAGARAVVLDEAHHAVARTYRSTLSYFMEKARCPILGLTATPGRSSSDETAQLARIFQRQLICPSWKNPHRTLVEQGVLANIHPIRIGGVKIVLTTEERKIFDIFKEIPESALGRVGEVQHRNQKITSALSQLSPTTAILVFAINKAHAQILTVAIKKTGRTVAFISGDTPKPSRRRIISAFRSGQISCLVNCEVLTTGFDAPKVEAVVLARPTFSSIKYEQMVGRGLRGIRNGGTDTCKIIDVVDNLDIHGETLSYARFGHEWQTDGSLFVRVGEAAEEDQIVS